MPTYETTRRFERDYARLNEAQKDKFGRAIRQFVDDLEHKQGIFRKSLRVERIKKTRDIYAMTWDKDSDVGRATFQYGKSRRAGQPHIIWRRCGSHEIYKWF